MLQKKNVDSIKQEMKWMKINNLGMSKVRWQGAGKITSFEIFYSGSTEQESEVAIVLDNEMGKNSKDFWPLSGRALLLKIAGNYWN